VADAALDDLGIVTGEAVALDVRPTSWPLRALGALIDWLCELGLFLALMFGVIAFGIVSGDAALSRALLIIDLVLSFVLVPTILETATRGRSVGRFAIGSRIVRDDGGAIAMRHAFIRALSGVVEIVFTLGGLAAVVGLLNRRSKRVGDLLAGTVSQHERVPKPPSNAVGVPESLTEWAGIADVGRLPDPLARRIAAFLAQAPRMAPPSRQRLASSLDPQHRERDRLPGLHRLRARLDRTDEVAVLPRPLDGGLLGGRGADVDGLVPLPADGADLEPGRAGV
jgi:uncharacterized RDD family membrane protein YckC